MASYPNPHGGFTSIPVKGAASTISNAMAGQLFQPSNLLSASSLGSLTLEEMDRRSPMYLEDAPAPVTDPFVLTAHSSNPINGASYTGGSHPTNLISIPTFAISIGPNIEGYFHGDAPCDFAWLEIATTTVDTVLGPLTAPITRAQLTTLMDHATVRSAFTTAPNFECVLAEVLPIPGMDSTTRLALQSTALINQLYTNLGLTALTSLPTTAVINTHNSAPTNGFRVVVKAQRVGYYVTSHSSMSLVANLATEYLCKAGTFDANSVPSESGHVYMNFISTPNAYFANAGTYDRIKDTLFFIMEVLHHIPSPLDMFNKIKANAGIWTTKTYNSSIAEELHAYVAGMARACRHGLDGVPLAAEDTQIDDITYNWLSLLSGPVLSSSHVFLSTIPTQNTMFANAYSYRGIGHMKSFCGADPTSLLRVGDIRTNSIGSLHGARPFKIEGNGMQFHTPSSTLVMENASLRMNTRNTEDEYNRPVLEINANNGGTHNVTRLGFRSGSDITVEFAGVTVSDDKSVKINDVTFHKPAQLDSTLVVTNDITTTAQVNIGPWKISSEFIWNTTDLKFEQYLTFYDPDGSRAFMIKAIEQTTAASYSD